jgi:hypothetical protein
MFAIEADTTAMQRLADAALNAAAGNAVRYQTFAPFALLTFADMARCTSGIDAMGWLPGRECAMFVPLLEREPDNPFHLRFVLWAPYIFIDYAIGMATGREVWGWPKVAAQIDIAPTKSTDTPFVCNTTYFKTFDPSLPGEIGPLYRIRRLSRPSQPPSNEWQSGVSAARAIIGDLGGRIGKVVGDLAGQISQTLGLQPLVPSVCLKQFRDSATPEHACYSAIVNSPIRITRFYGGGPLTDTLELEITTCRSHQIVQDLLGRDPDPNTTIVPIRWAAWVRVDFHALSGSTIVCSH